MACSEWPIAWPCEVPEPLTDQYVQAASFASMVLWSLSGRRLGVCSYTEGYWPECAAECGQPYKGSDGLWRNGGAASDCCRILVAHRPIVAVEQVMVDGIVMDPASYDWSDSYLKRMGACWPCGLDCEDPPVAVAYTAGFGYPAGTEAATGELACELIKGWNGDPCRLPSRAVSVSRQGVTVQMADPGAFITNGLIGLPLVDLWLRALNPNGLKRPSRVYSPDLARVERLRAMPTPFVTVGDGG